MLISQYIQHFANLTPGATAAISDGTPISYSALAGAIDRTGAEIASCGLPPRGTVALMVPNLVDCWVVTIALQAKGYTTISLSSTEILDELQIDNLVGVFLTTRPQVNGLEQCGAPVFTVEPPVFEEGTPTAPGVPEASFEETGHILYTSGTTGNYKQYRVTALTQQARDAERARYYRLASSTRFHCLGFGLWTAIGYNMPPSLWSVGGCVIFDQRNDVIPRFFEHQPSFAFILPDMAQQLCEETDPAFVAASQVQEPELYVCGGFISNRVAMTLRDRVSSNIFIMYGSSEVNSASFDQAYQSLDDLVWITPTGNRVVEIVDEQGQPCAVNEEGQLRVKLTDIDTQEYMNDPEASRGAFRGGYFYPGDMAMQREDGRFRILGRVADVVNLGGKKLSIAPIEANLQNVLGLDYVCLFSGIDASGESVIVVVMEATAPPAADRIQHVGQELSQWGEVRFACVSPFPRTQSGTSKIDRKQLRNMIFQN
jgi:acyl-coenzyme A synthetase/AMP-(fatty) acid ligase